MRAGRKKTWNVIEISYHISCHLVYFQFLLAFGCSLSRNNHNDEKWDSILTALSFTSLRFIWTSAKPTSPSPPSSCANTLNLHCGRPCGGSRFNGWMIRRRKNYYNDRNLSFWMLFEFISWDFVSFIYFYESFFKKNLLPNNINFITTTVEFLNYFLRNFIYLIISKSLEITTVYVKELNKISW